VAAQAIKRNDAPNNSFLFIIFIFQVKDTKLSSYRTELNQKGCLIEIVQRLMHQSTKISVI
jgi:hypothetical protein